MARYFVGSGTNWSSTSSWSDSDGGSSGFSVPTASDDAFLTASSPGDCVVDVAAVMRSINCTGFTHQLTMNASTGMDIGDGTAGAGNVALKFVNTMTISQGSVTPFHFNSTSATVQSVDFGGLTIISSITFVGVGGSWQLTAALTCTATVALSNGTLDTNGQTCVWGIFNSNSSNIRTLTLGSSLITITGTGTSWSTATTTNLTLNPGTSVITLTGSTGAFAGGVATYNNIVYAPTVAQTMSLGSVNAGTTTCANFTFASSITAKNEALNILSNLTATNMLSLSGNSVTNRLLVQSSTVGTACILTAATISISNIDFIDTTAAGLPGNAAWTGTSLGDGLGNSNITFDTPATQTRSGAGGNWSTAGSWTSRVPLPQDNVVINAGASGTITADMPRWGKDVNFTSFGGTINFTIGANIFGNFNRGTATFASNFASNFRGRGVQTITSNGARYPEAWNILSPGGSYTLQDDYVINTGGTGGLTLTAGTFDANGHNVTAGSFTSTGSITRTLNMGGGKWMLTSGGSFVWNVSSTGLTVNPSTSVIYVSDVSSSDKTASTGGFTYYGLVVNGGGTGKFIMGNATFSQVEFQGPKNLQFTGATTLNITNYLKMIGTGANSIVVTTASPASTYTITLGTSGTFQCSYSSLTNIAVTGTRTPVLAYHGTNVSGNTGFDFTTKRPSATPHTSATNRSTSATRSLASTRTAAS